MATIPWIDVKERRRPVYPVAGKSDAEARDWATARRWVAAHAPGCYVADVADGGFWYAGGLCPRHVSWERLRNNLSQ